ncbi:hypothetical protein D021_1928A, partial [Vibrio parahaemolyticus 10296]
MQALQ